MRAIAILAALAMVAGLFLPWLVSAPDMTPWDVVKRLDPSVEQVQKLAADAPELLAFLATFALAALFLALAILGAPSRALAFLAGGGAVAMVVYGALKMRDQITAFGLPVPSAENIGDLLPRIPEFLGMGAMAWGGGAFILLLTALIGFPSRR